jgi:hypothetical protein
MPNVSGNVSGRAALTIRKQRIVSDVSDVSDSLIFLARRLGRLAPSHRDPHKFHTQKSELLHELKQLASIIRRTL